MNAFRSATLATAILLSGCGVLGNETTETTGPPITVTETPHSTAGPESTAADTAKSSAPPSPPASKAGWESVFAVAGPAVVRIDVTQCEGSGGSGSGFVVAPDLIMTAAHVVAGARTVSVRGEAGSLQAAEVIGIAPENDVALVRLASPSSATPLSFATELPDRGSSMAVVGFPLYAETLQISEGIMSGLPRPVEYSDQSVEEAFVTDAATNPGNSGGPVLDRDGRVLGLVSGGQVWEGWDPETRIPVQGTNYVVPAKDLQPYLALWADRTDSLAAPCADEVEAPGDASIAVEVSADDPWAADFAQALYTHGLSINAGSYASAFSEFTPRLQGVMGGLQTWSQGLATSYWRAIVVTDTEELPEETKVSATITTNQESQWGPDGHTCSVWSLVYDFVPAETGWQIDAVHGDETAQC